MIPDYATLMLPLLRLVGEHERTTRDATAILADEFGLSEQEGNAVLPSGRTKTFNSRVHWAATYLVQAGLIERPKRGALRITARGKSVLDDPPDGSIINSSVGFLSL